MAASTLPPTNTIHQSTRRTTKRRSSTNLQDKAIIHSSHIGPYDIMCGRCEDAYNNIGNRRFRVTIRLNLDKYQSISSRHHRSLFFVSLVRFLKTQVGVRFLKPVHNKQLQGRWYMEMTKKECREKVAHAFRDLARTTKVQKETTVAAEQRMDAALTRVINEKRGPSPPPPSHTPDSIASSGNAASAAPIQPWNDDLMVFDDF